MKPEELSKGDMILVRWTDASDIKATLDEHSTHPEVAAKDWGVFLGMCGSKRRFVIIGKDVAEGDREWGATRIPVELVEDIRLLMPREDVALAIAEVGALGRRIRLRKHGRGEGALR